jgi:hypothetical protein
MRFFLGGKAMTFRYLGFKNTPNSSISCVFDLLFVFLKFLMQRQKDLLVILETNRSFGAKWVRMVGKINLCKGLFCKKQVLAFKPQIEVKLPYGFKWSGVFK